MKKLFFIALLLSSLVGSSQQAYDVRDIINGDTLWTSRNHPDSLFKSTGGVWTFYYKASTISYLPFNRVYGKPTTLAGYGISDAASTGDLTGYVATSVTVNGHALSANVTVTKSDLLLGSVENTALSTWAGTTNITTLGTIASGTWQGAVLSSTYGGTGVNNGGRTLTISTNNGIINFSNSSLTLTVSGNATVLGNNTGDQSTITGNAGSATILATGRTIGITGDATWTSPSFDGSQNVTASITVTKINGTSLAALGTGILKNTTGTGVPSIAIAADFPTLNQNTSGSAATLGTPRAIYGNNFDGSAALAQIIASGFGGTGNGFTKFSGATTSEKTYTLPDASVTIYTTSSGSISSANLITSVSDEQGSGSLVFSTSPTLTTPVLGAATATTINKVTITAPGTSATLTLITGSSLITAGAFALTLTSTATSNATIPAGTNTLYSTLSGSITSAQLATSLTNETGSGVVVYGTSPTFTTSITLPTGASGQVPVLWVSGTLKTSATAAGMEYNGTFYQTKASGLRYAQGGIIADFITSVSNSTTAETDLYTYTTPANTLNNDGEKIIAEFAYLLSDATSSIQIKVYFAGTAIFDSGAVPNGATTTGDYVRAIIIRTSSTTARCITTLSNGYNNATLATQTDLTGLTLSGTNIIKTTGTASGASGGTGDVTAKLGTISWYGIAAN